jgi:hypothetical protein
MKTLIRPLRIMLPIALLIFSYLLLLGLTIVHYYHLKRAAGNSDGVSLGTNETRIYVPSNTFLRFALLGASLELEKPIKILNAPAHFANVVIAQAVSQEPFWSPPSIGPTTWDCITLPIFALPAWWYVGLGVDALLGRKRIRASNGVLSLALLVVFGTIAAVLHFGLRDEPDLKPGFKEGFTLWTLLFAVPFIAWLRQKLAGASA